MGKHVGEQVLVVLLAAGELPWLRAPYDLQVLLYEVLLNFFILFTCNMKPEHSVSPAHRDTKRRVNLFRRAVWRGLLRRKCRLRGEVGFFDVCKLGGWPEKKGHARSFMLCCNMAALDAMPGPVLFLDRSAPVGTLEGRLLL